jgi:hypothetical protein
MQDVNAHIAKHFTYQLKQNEISNKMKYSDNDVAKYQIIWSFAAFLFSGGGHEYK